MYPFKHIKGVAKTQCKCGALLGDCYACNYRAQCHSCAKCQNCNVRVRETWRLDPQKPVRFDMKQADQDKGRDLVIPRYPVVVDQKNVEIIGKGGRKVRAKGLKRKQEI